MDGANINVHAHPSHRGTVSEFMKTALYQTVWCTQHYDVGFFITSILQMRKLRHIGFSKPSEITEQIRDATAGCWSRQICSWVFACWCGHFSTSLPLFYDFPKATSSQMRYLTVNVMFAAQVSDGLFTKNKLPELFTLETSSHKAQLE